MKLFVDAGHGGSDPGVVGHTLEEKTLNLAVALALEQRLQHCRDIEVMLSRYADVSMSLQERTDRANAWGADVFLSIHHNGFIDPKARGIETFHSIRPGDSKQFAEVIQAALCNTFPLPNRGVKIRLNKAGRDWYHVLRESRAPIAIIAETGFVTNPEDAKVLRIAAFPATQAETIAQEIKQHFGIEPKDGPFPDVSINHWAVDAIAFVSSTEPSIMSGFNDGNFRPNDPVTRAQLASALHRMALYLRR